MIIIERETIKTNKYLKVSGDDIGISEIKQFINGYKNLCFFKLFDLSLVTSPENL